MGPASTKVASITGQPANKNSRVYVLDNLGPTRISSNLDEWDITSLAKIPHQSNTPTFNLSNTIPTSSSETVLKNIEHAGARVKEENFVDTRIKYEAYTGTGIIKDCLDNCKNKVGQIDPDISNTRTFALPVNPNGDDNLDGYTNLENWLFSFYQEVQ